MTDQKVVDLVMMIRKLDAEQTQALCDHLAIICNAEMRLALDRPAAKDKAFEV